MEFYKLVLGVLSVWRITHLLQAEDGPWDLVVRLRGKAGDGFWGKLLDCFYCLSLWIAVPFAIGLGTAWPERMLLWPALSAAAILLERIGNPATPYPSAEYLEDKEEGDAVLRPTENANHGE